MRIIVAPDSFKGSLSALGVAEAMARGIHAVFPDAEVLKVPIADGGEGTVEALVAATGGRLMHTDVRGPLGDPVRAHWGISGDGATAFLEMASASGLPLISRERRDPRRTSTFGTGELMKAALDAGLRRLVIGIGGSATNDGGTGMARALGVRFLDAAGRDPLCGPRGASAVYGPQKGATPDLVAELDTALAVFATIAAQATGRDIAHSPGAGAAGGLGAGLLFFTPARLRPGVAIVLETTGFEALVQGADLVLTGEGRTDFQTAMGKAPVGVAAVARRHGVPVICLSGGLGDGAEDVLAHGIDALASTVPQPMALEACMEQGATLVEAGTRRVCRMLSVGMALRR